MRIADDVLYFALATRAVALSLALLAFGTTIAHAQVTDRWQFEATPYLWAAGMKGDVGIGR